MDTVSEVLGRLRAADTPYEVLRVVYTNQGTCRVHALIVCEYLRPRLPAHVVWYLWGWLRGATFAPPLTYTVSGANHPHSMTFGSLKVSATS